ncbi:MAG: Ig-like domain-containing protein, partial [Muribaculaceae bacterium]|nr:Ig-like domain-containing protein [Muribaculaceae bacterium]
ENASVKTLKWTTSNAKVATVKDGVVTGVGEGNAVITVSTTDGSNLSATCKVRVLEAWVESIVIEPQDLFIKLNQKDTLDVVILPSQATIRTLVWTTSNDKVVTVEDGVVTAVGIGQADITATATDGTGVTGTCHVTVTREDLIRGDANDDKYVDVTDYLVTANYILWEGTDEANRGPKPHPFEFGAADVDADSLITVNDLTGIINIGLGRDEAPKGAKVKGMTMPNPVLSGTLTGNEVTLALSHEMLITGVQLDVTVPEGARVEEVALSSRAGYNHKVRFAEMGGGRVRVLVSSATNETLNGMAGDLLTLKLGGEVSGEVLVQHVIASAPDVTAYPVNELRLAPIATGLNELAEGTARIYEEAGRLVIESAEAGIAQLVQMGGIAKTLNVQAGRNVYDVPVAGIVVVRMGANAVKLTF